MINGQSGEIIFVSEAKGSVHDFEMFKRSGIRLADDILLVGDKGFQGICDIHAFSVTPFKKPKGDSLTEEQKEFNRSLSSYRIRIEHVHRRVKRFKIFQLRYRNKQRNHSIRFEEWTREYTYDIMEKWKRRRAPSAAKKQTTSKEDLHQAVAKKKKEKCKSCGKVYTPKPKKNGYSEEEKRQALKYYYEGNSGRSTGRFFGMSKANAVR